MTALERTPRHYGWVPQLPDRRDFRLSHSAADIAARPPTTDLSILPAMPPVYDQGQLGSCVGNSVAGAVEYNIRTENKGLWQPSRLFIYYNARRLEGTTSSDSGASIRDGVKGVVEWGTPAESFWHYDIGKFADTPPAPIYAKAMRNIVTSYLAVPQTIADICTTLAGKEPIVFGFSVYSAFESAQVASTGVVNMPGPNERLIGGHSPLIVGYDDSIKRFKCRNSWGLSWGMPTAPGYFTIPYDYIASPQLSSDFWVIRNVK